MESSNPRSDVRFIAKALIPTFKTVYSFLVRHTNCAPPCYLRRRHETFHREYSINFSVKHKKVDRKVYTIYTQHLCFGHKRYHVVFRRVFCRGSVKEQIDVRKPLFIVGFFGFSTNPHSSGVCNEKGKQVSFMCIIFFLCGQEIRKPFKFSSLMATD